MNNNNFNDENRTYVLKLFVSGATDTSRRAIENIRKICKENLKDNVELEIIDIYQQPEKARLDQIIAVPTLIKKLPKPIRKFIGDLSDDSSVFKGLEIESLNK